MIFGAKNDKKLTDTIELMERGIIAPYKDIYLSTLGGIDRATIIIRLSLDAKRTWYNKILQNSRYAFFRLDRDGTLVQFSVGPAIPKKMRKIKVKSISEAVDKINRYIDLMI